MITLLKSYVANPVDNNTIKSRAVMLLTGLNADEKPLIEFKDVEIENGSSFIQIDTSKTYKYDEENNLWIQQVTEDSGGSSITVDLTLSSTSRNPVQNRVIFNALEGKAGNSVVTTSANGLMSATDKTTLDELAADYHLALVAMGVIEP